MKQAIKSLFHQQGLFSKIMVLFCIVYSIRVIEWAMGQYEATGLEPGTILAVAIGLFGGELLLLCLKRVLTKSDSKAQGEEPGVVPPLNDDTDLII